jgi:hypothetical protein
LQYVDVVTVVAVVVAVAVVEVVVVVAVVLVVVVVPVVAVVVVTVDTAHVSHNTGHMAPIVGMKVQNAAGRGLQSSGSSTLLHLLDLVVVVRVVVEVNVAVTPVSTHDRHKTGHVALKTDPANPGCAHVETGTLAHASGSAKVLHNSDGVTVVWVVVVAVVATVVGHESHLRGQFKATLGTSAHITAGMPKQSAGSSIAPLQLGVVVVVLDVAVIVLVVVVAVVVVHTPQSAGHNI